MKYVRRIRWGLITLDARFAQWWRNSAHRDLGAILTQAELVLRRPWRRVRWLDLWDDVLDAVESLRDALTDAPLRGGLRRKFRRVWVKFAREVPIRFDFHDVGMSDSDSIKIPAPVLIGPLVEVPGHEYDPAKARAAYGIAIPYETIRIDGVEAREGGVDEPASG